MTRFHGKFTKNGFFFMENIFFGNVTVASMIKKNTHAFAGLFPML
jgi:hypothetical protein